MKKINLIFFLSLSSILLIAQQRPHYSQYIMNNYIVNPAIGGIENYIDVKLSIRNQWVGFDGAPKTFYATIHGPISKKDYRSTFTSFDTKGMNPRGKYYWEDYTSAAPHHGLGMTVVNYSTGYINRLTGFATYSYHLGITDKTSLAAGFGLCNDFMNTLSFEVQFPIPVALNVYKISSRGLITLGLSVSDLFR